MRSKYHLQLMSLQSKLMSCASPLSTDMHIHYVEMKLNKKKHTHTTIQIETPML